MITNGILQFFGQIVGYLVNVIPDAPTIPSDFLGGVSAGTTCCASVVIGLMAGILANANGGSVSGLANKTPIPLFIDMGMIGFFLGCAFDIIAAFFIVKILMTFWTLVKW